MARRVAPRCGACAPSSRTIARSAAFAAGRTRVRFLRTARTARTSSATSSPTRPEAEIARGHAFSTCHGASLEVLLLGKADRAPRGGEVGIARARETAVSAGRGWLGHADPEFTLRTYVHLPDGGDRSTSWTTR